MKKQHYAHVERLLRKKGPKRQPWATLPLLMMCEVNWILTIPPHAARFCKLSPPIGDGRGNSENEIKMLGSFGLQGVTRPAKIPLARLFFPVLVKMSLFFPSLSLARSLWPFFFPSPCRNGPSFPSTFLVLSPLFSLSWLSSYSVFPSKCPYISPILLLFWFLVLSLYCHVWGLERGSWKIKGPTHDKFRWDCE